jgi:hypothetical protein
MLTFGEIYHMPRPDLTRIPAYYHQYVDRVKEDNLQQAFAIHMPEALTFLQNIPDAKWNYRYAEGKWSIKDLLQHLIDTERIFQYRALRFSRKDATELPGFDENLFSQNADAGRRSKDDLVEEFGIVQQSSHLLFQSFNEEQLKATGTANGNQVYVEGIGFIIIGHMLHHLNVIKERYL